MVFGTKDLQNMGYLDPQGIFEVSGSQSHTFNGIWDQRPQILATSTLRV